MPKVSNAADVRAIIEHARFFPLRMRGMCRFVRAARYSATERHSYFREANQARVIVHLEGVEAITELDDILQVKGMDILFIGAYDLSQSLWVPGQVHDPRISSSGSK